MCWSAFDASAAYTIDFGNQQSEGLLDWLGVTDNKPRLYNTTYTQGAGLAWNADNSFGITLNTGFGVRDQGADDFYGQNVNFSHTLNWNADGGYEGATNDIQLGFDYRDREAALAAIEKLRDGGTLTPAELAALDSSAAQIDAREEKKAYIQQHRDAFAGTTGGRNFTDEEIDLLLKGGQIDGKDLSDWMHAIGAADRSMRIDDLARQLGRPPTEEEIENHLAGRFGETRGFFGKIFGGVTDWFSDKFLNTYSDDDGFIDPETGEWRQNTCFTAGTPVLVHASTEGAHYERGRYYKPIEDIREGDIVLSFNEDTQTVEPKRVTQTFVRQTDRIYRVRYTTGEEFETTFNHEFFVKNVGWVQAKQLRPGDLSITANDSVRTIASVSGEARYETVYNFEVEDNHTYFVGRDGVLVHNQTAGETYTRLANEYRAGMDHCGPDQPGRNLAGCHIIQFFGGRPFMDKLHINNVLKPALFKALAERYPDYTPAEIERMLNNRSAILDFATFESGYSARQAWTTTAHSSELTRLANLLENGGISAAQYEREVAEADRARDSELADIASDRAEELRRRLASFGPGPAGDIQRELFIFNLTIDGVVSLGAGVEIAATLLPLTKLAGTARRLMNVVRLADGAGDAALALRSAKLIEGSLARRGAAANDELALAARETAEDLREAAGRHADDVAESVRPPASGPRPGTTQPPRDPLAVGQPDVDLTRPSRPGSSANILDNIPVSRTVDGVVIVIRPADAAPDLLRTIDAPQGFSFWGRGNSRTGYLWERAAGGRGAGPLGRLPDNYPVIDGIVDRVAISRKTMDFNATTYRTTNRAVTEMMQNIDEVAGFRFSLNNPPVQLGRDFDRRALEVLVPRGTLNTAHGIRFLQDMHRYAADKGVMLRVFEGP